MKVAHKHLRQDRESTPPLVIERLPKLKFGWSCYIDWDVIREIGLANEVYELADMGSWDWLLLFVISLGETLL